MSDHFKPATWARPGYWADDRAFREVVIDNSYKLPDDMEGWNCLDIGGHVGSFVYAALERGASKIISVEADPRNFARLQANVEAHPYVRDGSASVRLIHGAAWRSDKPGELLGMKAFKESPRSNTGGGSVATADSPDFQVPAHPVAPLIEELGTVDFMKVDCEGSEFPILFTLPDHTLAKVQRIVAELHTNFFWKREAVVLGRFTGDLEKGLGSFLTRHGFTVTTEEQHLHHRPLMFAERA